MSWSLTVWSSKKTLLSKVLRYLMSSCARAHAHTHGD